MAIFDQLDRIQGTPDRKPGGGIVHGYEDRTSGGSGARSSRTALQRNPVRGERCPEHLPDRRYRSAGSGRCPSPSALAPRCESVPTCSPRGVSLGVDGEDSQNPGDTIRIAPGERHVTRNTGDGTPDAVGFFPVPGGRSRS